MNFNPDKLLASLPKRRADKLRVGSAVPKMPSVGSLSIYNGFTGKERLRTFEISKWLIASGCYDAPARCELCGLAADNLHAENYYDLASWIDLCRSCHLNRLHQRFNHPAAWLRWLDSCEVDSGHWARHVAIERFDLASLLRSRGAREPQHSDFVS